MGIFQAERVRRTALLAVCLLNPVSVGTLQASLQTGDIAIIGMASDNRDEWSWVPLVDLAAGETVYFTDTSYSARRDRLARREGLVQYIAPEEGLSAGTVVTVQETWRNRFSESNHVAISARPWGRRRFSLVSRGDALLAFQTDDLSMGLSASGYNPIYAVTSLTTDWNAHRGRPSQLFTNLYPGLIDGETAVAAGRGARRGDEWDNIRYVGPTSGRREQLLSWISDADFWEGTNRNPKYGYTNNGVSSFHVSTNPEPASLLVWTVLGVGGVVARTRRRRRDRVA